MAQKLEQGRYIVTDIRSGMALDLSGADNRSLIAFGLHGWENQQVRPSLRIAHGFLEVLTSPSTFYPPWPPIVRRRTVLHATYMIA